MPPSSRLALVQIFNLRTIALVFYLCLGMALSGALGWYVPETPVSDWQYTAARFTRQSLITGLSLLAAVALTRAGCCAWPWPPCSAP
jgi:uncharacterized membrane protein YraQ (UPF0718 family)